ncbi:MAG: sigma-70 family RNA polymerase sigma factor, partial [Egibacteraceae bacterium]
MWEQFAGRLRAFIATRVSNPADAEDILQDVFVKVHRGARELRDTERLTTWIFRIAHNAIIDHYRSAPRRRETPVEELARFDVVPPVDAAIDDQSVVRAEIAGCLRPLIAELPGRRPRGAELVDLGGMSQTAAARQLGLSVSGMKSRVQRARARV